MAIEKRTGGGGLFGEIPEPENQHHRKVAKGLGERKSTPKKTPKPRTQPAAKNAQIEREAISFSMPTLTPFHYKILGGVVLAVALGLGGMKGYEKYEEHLEAVALEEIRQAELARQKAEAERLAAEQAEAERLEKERLAREEAERAERETKAKAERERLAAERAEREAKAKAERAEREAQAKVQAEARAKELAAKRQKQQEADNKAFEAQTGQKATQKVEKGVAEIDRCLAKAEQLSGLEQIVAKSNCHMQEQQRKIFGR